MKITIEFKDINEYLEFKQKTVINDINITTKILTDTQNEMLEILRKENITAKEALENLSNCKSSIFFNMPIEKNLNDKFTW